MNLEEKVIHADCFDVFPLIPDQSIDLILCDLPYGTTKCKWDYALPLDKLWNEYKRIIKPNGAILLHCSQPFTSVLVCSNLEWFKLCYVWDKIKPVGTLVSKFRCMQQTEEIALFGSGRVTFNPQMTKRDKPRIGGKEYSRTTIMGGKFSFDKQYDKTYEYKNPTNLIRFSNASNKDRIHPTQKPLDLIKYLIETHSNEGDLILDNCAGSFTTAVACDDLNNKWICIEKNEEFCKKGQERINKNRQQYDDLKDKPVEIMEI